MQLPAPFIIQTRSLLGDEAFGQLVEALQQEPPVSIRLNHKCELTSSPVLQERVPWCRDGYYLAERLTFTFDPLFHAGCYYVQEASSMFVEQVMRQYVTEPSVMLDLCAAPGGKSTHARSLLPEGSLLVANEVIRNRSQILAENLTKWGYPGVVVTNNDPADFAALGEFFDIILTDVPCSGEGMFRKDPVAVDEWSPENVDICWQRQRRILADIWSCLRPGGLLIYSTCTYNTKEDEENVNWMQQELGAELLKVDVPAEWGITGNLLPTSDAAPVYRFLPHRTKGEGFFLAALRKSDTAALQERATLYKSDEAAHACNYPASVSYSSDETFIRNEKRSKKNNDYNASKKPNKKNSAGKTVSLVPKEVLSATCEWLLYPDAFEFLTEGTAVTAFPKGYVEELTTLRQSLRVIQAGIALGEMKGKDFIPGHALAMSAAYRPGSFPEQEIPYEQAIAYLRKESITLPEEAARGYVLLTYKTIPLGFVKNIGNRANNLYPQEWRIRSGYLPEKLLLL